MTFLWPYKLEEIPCFNRTNNQKTVNTSYIVILFLIKEIANAFTLAVVFIRQITVKTVREYGLGIYVHGSLINVSIVNTYDVTISCLKNRIIGLILEIDTTLENIYSTLEKPR